MVRMKPGSSIEESPSVNSPGKSSASGSAPSSAGGAAPKVERRRADTQLIEQLVRASINVNPALRDGKSTQEVMDVLAEQMGVALPATAAKPAAPKPPSAAPSPAVAPARTNPPAAPSPLRDDNIRFFLESKCRQAAELEESLASRRKALEREEQEAKERRQLEVIDFITLVTPSPDEARRLLTQHARLLRQLGLNEADLLRALAGRTAS